MATIVDHQIRHLCRTTGLIEPFNPEFINPASYDVTIGPIIKVENDHGLFTEIDVTETIFWMPPGGFVLAATAEFVRIPVNLESTFQLKSSRGREGYEHALAGYIDPGYQGEVTLELSNLRRFKELPLYAGLRIGQLRFSKLDATPMRSYAQTGRYCGDRGPVESKG